MITARNSFTAPAARLRSRRAAGERQRAARDIHLSQPGVTPSDPRLGKRPRRATVRAPAIRLLCHRVRRDPPATRAALLGTPPFGIDGTDASPAGRQSIDATRQQDDAAATAQPHCRFRESVIRCRGAFFENFAALAAPLGPRVERELRRSLYRRTAPASRRPHTGPSSPDEFRLRSREIEYGLDELQAARGNIVSRIAIGNIPHSATQILSNAIKEFLSRYPTARVQIVDGHYEDLLNELRAGKLDLLFGVLRRPDWADRRQGRAAIRQSLRRGGA